MSIEDWEILLEPDLGHASEGKSYQKARAYSPVLYVNMNIQLNGDDLVIESSSTVLDVLEKQGMAEKKGIAVAVNQSVVPRTEWADRQINENDKLLIITATQGG